MASPSPYGSFIRCLMSVYPDAFGAAHIPEVHRGQVTGLLKTSQGHAKLTAIMQMSQFA